MRKVPCGRAPLARVASEVARLDVRDEARLAAQVDHGHLDGARLGHHLDRLAVHLDERGRQRLVPSHDGLQAEAKCRLGQRSPQAKHPTDVVGGRPELESIEEPQSELCVEERSELIAHARARVDRSCALAVRIARARARVRIAGGSPRPCAGASPASGPGADEQEMFVPEFAIARLVPFRELRVLDQAGDLQGRRSCPSSSPGWRKAKPISKSSSPGRKRAKRKGRPSQGRACLAHTGRGMLESGETGGHGNLLWRPQHAEFLAPTPGAAPACRSWDDGRDPRRPGSPDSTFVHRCT